MKFISSALSAHSIIFLKVAILQGLILVQRQFWEHRSQGNTLLGKPAQVSLKHKRVLLKVTQSSDEPAN